MTARESSAVCRCPARSTAVSYRYMFDTGTTAYAANRASRSRVPRVGRGELAGVDVQRAGHLLLRPGSGKDSTLPHPARRRARRTRATRWAGRVSTSSLGRPVAAAARQGPEPSRYWVSSRLEGERRRWRPRCVGLPRVEDGHRGDRLARAGPGRPASVTRCEDRLEGVLGEGEAAELVEGRLDRRPARRRGISRTALRVSGTGRTRAGGGRTGPVVCRVPSGRDRSPCTARRLCDAQSSAEPSRSRLRARAAAERCRGRAGGQSQVVTRTVVPRAEERTCTRSQSWLTR